MRSSAAAVTPLGLLHMRPHQHWLHSRVWRWAWRHVTLRVNITQECRRTFSPRTELACLWAGVPLEQVFRHIFVTAYASSTGWGATCNGQAAAGLRTRPRRLWHINCLELLTVHLALWQFQPLLLGKHVLVRTDNTAAVSYINRLGGIRSHRMSQLARHLLLWSHTQLKSLRAVHIPGKLNHAVKVYVATIAAHHDAVDGRSLGKHDLIVSFLRGARRMNPTRSLLMPSCDQVVTLQALPSEEADSALACPVRTLCIYVDRTRSFRSSEQLFVCHGGQQKGKAVSKQRLAYWIVDAITFAHQSQGQRCPLGVSAHSIWSVASSYALVHGASHTSATPGWATPSNFARFYSLRVEPVSSCVLGNR